MVLDSGKRRPFGAGVVTWWGDRPPESCEGADASTAKEGIVDLSLATSEVDGATVITVGGDVDVYAAPRLRDQITELVADGEAHHLVIDLSAVEFLDSTGLGVLVGGLKKVRSRGGTLRLVCTQERLLKIFRITGLAKVFEIHDTPEAAASF